MASIYAETPQTSVFWLKFFSVERRVEWVFAEKICAFLRFLLDEGGKFCIAFLEFLRQNDFDHIVPSFLLNSRKDTTRRVLPAA